MSEASSTTGPEVIPSSLGRLRELADQGDPGLREALAALDARTLRDASLHGELARIAESAGDIERAILEYNLALRDDPAQPALLFRLGQLRMDQGELARAVKCLSRLVEMEPSHEDGRALLVEALRGSGAEELAQQQAALLPDVPRWRSLKRGGQAVEPDPLAAPHEEEPPAFVVRDADCISFHQAFSARDGVYARQWASPTSKSGYTPVHEPLTTAVVRHHLLGDYTVGAYTLRHDNTVRWIALDIDINSGALLQARGPRTLARLQQLAHTVACSLLDLCARKGLAPLLEDSGNKGRHLWLLLAEPVAAAAAKRIGEWLVSLVEPLPQEIHIEVFPKQGRTGEDGLGNLIKLPLGIHRVSGRRCWLIDPQGQPLRSPFSAISALPRVSREQLLALHQEASSSPRKAARSAPEPLTEEAGTGVAAPQATPYSIEQDDEVRWLRQRCAVIADLIHRAETTRMLSNEERLVLTYTLGNLARGSEAVNAVLSKALNVDRSVWLKSALRGHPMSCPKIRSRVADVCARVGCDCSFDGTASYPHPLLHIEALKARPRLARNSVELSAAEIERLGLDWIKVNQDRLRLEQLTRELEAKLIEIVQARGPLPVAAAGVIAIEEGRLVLKEPQEAKTPEPAP